MPANGSHPDVVALPDDLGKVPQDLTDVAGGLFCISLLCLYDHATIQTQNQETSMPSDRMTGASVCRSSPEHHHTLSSPPALSVQTPAVGFHLPSAP